MLVEDAQEDKALPSWLTPEGLRFYFVKSVKYLSAIILMNVLIYGLFLLSA